MEQFYNILLNILLMVASGAISVGAVVMVGFLVRLDKRIKRIEIAFSAMSEKLEQQIRQGRDHSVFINEYIQSKIRS